MMPEIKINSHVEQNKTKPEKVDCYHGPVLRGNVHDPACWHAELGKGVLLGGTVFT